MSLRPQALTLCRTGIRRVFTNGPFDTAAWVRYHAYERYCERRLGVRTADSASWVGSHADPALSVYKPISYDMLNRALAALPDVCRDGAFLDYGSGMGRVVAAAATRPFSRVTGIELLPELTAIARANLRAVGERGRLRCSRVELLTTDATAYEVPADVSAVFLFNRVPRPGAAGGPLPHRGVARCGPATAVGDLRPTGRGREPAGGLRLAAGVAAALPGTLVGDSHGAVRRRPVGQSSGDGGPVAVLGRRA